MPENTQQNEEEHPTVKRRNIMLILAAAAIIAGLCHAYCSYVAPMETTPAEESPAAEVQR